MFRKIQLGFLLSCIVSFVMSQEYPVHLEMMNENDIPKNSERKVPHFFELLLRDTININQLDEAFEEFEKEEKREKAEKKAKGIFKEEESENPYERFFLLWREEVESFLNQDGQFDLDLYQRYKQYQLEKSNSRSTRSANKSSSKILQSTGVWKPIGTHENYRSGQKRPWQQNIYFIDVFKSDTNIQYITTEKGLLFKTTDKGENWEYQNSVKGPIAIDPTNSNKIFVASNRLFTSSDGGNSGNYTFDFEASGNNIIISENNPNVLFVATWKGLYRSIDKGINWTKQIDENISDVAFHVNNHDIVYAVGSKGGFYKSIDGGATFTSNEIETSASGTLVAVTKDNPNVVYISYLKSSEGGMVIYKSTDTGTSFTKIRGFGGTGQGFYDFILEVNPLNEDEILIGTTTLYKSKDSGLTTTNVGGYRGPFPIHPDLQDAVAIDGEFFLATDGGVTYSTDFFESTDNFSYKTNGVWSQHFWGWDHCWNEDLWGGGRYHNGNVVNRGEWGNHSLSVGGAESPAGVCINGVGMAFRDIRGGAVMEIPKEYTATDAERKPSIQPFRGHPNQYTYGARVGEVKPHPEFNNVLFTAQGNFIKYSVDTGQTFTEMHDFGSNTWEIHIARSNPKKMYVVANGRGTKLYVSNNVDQYENSTWTEITTPTSGNIYVQLDETDENKLWLSNGSKVYTSTDGGANWQNISPTGNFAVDRIVKQMGVEGAIYAIVYNKDNFNTEVLYRDDALGTWVDYSSGLLDDEYRYGRIKPFPFYAKNKLRFGSGIGTWEADFYKTDYNVISQPTADAYPFRCVNKQIQLDSYSVVNQSNVEWKWTFSETPASIDNDAIRNPVVSFSTGGTKTATLQVKDLTTGKVNANSINFEVQETTRTINSLDNPTGENIITGANIILNTNVPSTATLKVYFSETFKMTNPSFIAEGKVHVEKVPIDYCR